MPIKLNGSSSGFTQIDAASVAGNNTLTLPTASGTLMTTGGTNTFTANQVIEVTDNTNAALRITQLGTGNALLVEDSTNPDSTPFVVDASGNVGIGTNSPLGKLDVNGPSGVTSFTGTTRLGVMVRGSTATTDYSGIDFTGASGSTPYARIAMLTSASGSVLQLGTSNNYGSGVTNSAVSIDPSGNVGIGATPTASQGRLQVVNTGITGGSPASSGTTDANQIAELTAGSVQLRFGVTSPGDYWLQPSLSSNYATNTNLLLCPNGGKVGIGTSSPGSSLTVYGSTGAGVSIANASTGTGATNGFQMAVGAGSDAYIWNYSSGFISFATANSERMRLDASGNLLIASTNASPNIGTGIKLVQNSGVAPLISLVGSASTNSDSSYHVYSTGAAAYRFYVGYGGTIYATSATITALSDVRLKENIQDLDVGLAAINKLRPRKFDWKAGKGADIKNARGFIAQEFEQIFPDLIDTWKDPAPEGEEPYKSVRPDLIPVLVKAIQELSAKNDALEARIAALENA